MKGNIEERCVQLGQYIVEHNSTVRACASQFKISKSTVHKDVTSRLYVLNPQLWAQVKQVLEKNKLERHLRGGAATREKYQRQRG
ncbi:MAG: sporulation transcriptional regulator SpoIIID [Eubacteriales bacterium]